MLICLMILGQSAIQWSFDPQAPTQAFVKARVTKHATLQVWHESYFGRDLPPMLGKVIEAEGEIIFRPQFPFEPGQKYCALLSEGGSNESACFTFPQVRQSQAKVISVWPKEYVPANLMRFYVTFDRPMGNVDPVHFTTLRDKNGDLIPEAFVEVQGGLWDPNRRRLTLIIHPGRTKREVGPNHVLGPVLNKGKSYTLAIENLPSANGMKSLAWQHHFEVHKEDRQPISPWKWKIRAQEGSLTVMPGIDIDPYTFMNHVSVLKNGESIKGSWVFLEEQYQWQGAKLSQEKHELHIGNLLEDWAGNRPGVSFERNPGSNPEQSYKIPFEVKKP